MWCRVMWLLELFLLGMMVGLQLLTLMWLTATRV